MIKAILFDFDGTIVDSLPFCLKAYDRALKKFNLHFTDKKIVKNCFSKTEETICQNLKIKDLNTFRNTYFDGVNYFFKDVKLFPNVLDTINFERNKQIKLAITSFAYRWYIDKMIKKLNLRNFFDVILGADDVKNLKPHPEIALKACKKLKVSTSCALMVGDSKGDMLVGKAAGCQTALFFPKKHKLFYNLNDLKKTNPDYIFSKFTQLKNILSRKQ